MSRPRSERPYRDLPTGALLAALECVEWDRAGIAEIPEDWDFPVATAAYLSAVHAELAAEVDRRKRLLASPLAPPWPDRRAQLDELKRRVDLVAAFERWTGATFRKAGQQHRARCPFHTGHAPNDLAVDTEKGLWFCFGCLKGGDVFDLALAVFDPPSFAAAVDVVAREAGMPRSQATSRWAGAAPGRPREGSVRVA